MHLESPGAKLKKIATSGFFLYSVIFLLALKICLVGFAIGFSANFLLADITKSALVDFVNQDREAAGLKVLSENKKLDNAAMLKAQNMLKNNYFNHTSPSGITPWHWFYESGYNYKYAGENLAIGFYDSVEVYNAWLSSPSHKENILNPNYSDVGTAVLNGFGANNATLVVQLFASPETVKQTGVVSPAAVKSSASVKSVEPFMVDNAEPDQAVLGEATNFARYNFYPVLSEMIFGVSMVLTGVLLSALVFGKGAMSNKKLILRAVVIIAILFGTVMIGKENVILFIPHIITI